MSIGSRAQAPAGSLRIGFVSTRFAGTDGVSLETAKWATVLEGMGHRVEICHGPGGHDGCPLVEEGTCELVNRAHGVAASGGDRLPTW